jgi:alpha-tubulin suppressor-like RCC1 family protein
VSCISLGHLFGAVVTRAGNVVCWGFNRLKQCEAPDTLENVAAVSCGIDHSCALTQEGKLVCWGTNEFGQRNIPEDIEVMMRGYILL